MHITPISMFTASNACVASYTFVLFFQTTVCPFYICCVLFRNLYFRQSLLAAPSLVGSVSRLGGGLVPAGAVTAIGVNQLNSAAVQDASIGASRLETDVRSLFSSAARLQGALNDSERFLLFGLV